MKKKICFALAAVFMVAVSLSGCAEKGMENFVKDYYNTLIKGEMTGEKSYDEYISQVSKDLLNINKEEYVKRFNENIESNKNREYTSIEIVDNTNYNDTIYRIKINMIAKVNGETTKIPATEYIINEDGKYKFLQYGVQSKQQVETKFSSDTFGMAIDRIYAGPDKIMINLIANNPTTSQYAVGFGGNARILVETENGTIEKSIPGTNIIKPVDKNEGLQEIEGVKGKIKSIVIYNIYRLDGSGKPKDVNSSSSYVLYEDKES